MLKKKRWEFNFDRGMPHWSPSTERIAVAYRPRYNKSCFTIASAWKLLAASNLHATTRVCCWNRPIVASSPIPPLTPSDSDGFHSRVPLTLAAVSKRMSGVTSELGTRPSRPDEHVFGKVRILPNWNANISGSNATSPVKLGHCAIRNTHLNMSLSCLSFAFHL